VVNRLICLVDQNQTLHVFDAGRQEIGLYSGVAHIESYAFTGRMGALLTADQEVFLFQPDGSLLDRFAVRPNSALIAAPDGGIYLRDQGRLEYISATGGRRLLLDDLDINRTDSAMHLADSGQIILWGVEGKDKLMAVAADGQIVWETIVDVDDLLGVRLAQPNACTLVIADRYGHLLAFEAQTGRLLGQVRVWGSHLNQVWVGSYPDDDVLRLYIADQLIGFDTTVLSGRACD
jgi:hypothetical protein